MAEPVAYEFRERLRKPWAGVTISPTNRAYVQQPQGARAVVWPGR